TRTNRTGVEHGGTRGAGDRLRGAGIHVRSARRSGRSRDRRGGCVVAAASRRKRNRSWYLVLRPLGLVPPESLVPTAPRTDQELRTSARANQIPIQPLELLGSPVGVVSQGPLAGGCRHSFALRGILEQLCDRVCQRHWIAHWNAEGEIRYPVSHVTNVRSDRRDAACSRLQHRHTRGFVPG